MLQEQTKPILLSNTITVGAGVIMSSL